jgi:hypothetical protein
VLCFLFFIQRSKYEKGLWLIPLYTVIFGTATLIYNNYYQTSVPPNFIRKFFYAFLTFFEFSCFAYFLWINIKSSNFKKVIFISSLGFVVFIITYTILSKFQRIDSFPIGIETIIILIFSFYFFYEKMNDPNTLFIYNDYRFWIVLAFMIYLSGSFFIYIFANQIPKKDMPQYWMFTDIFYALKNIFFLIGILVFALQPKKKHPIKPKANHHHYLDIT